MKQIFIHGKVALEHISADKASYHQMLQQHAQLFAAGHSAYDIPIGETFTQIKKEEDPIFIPIEPVKLVYINNTYGQILKEIPRGWKTLIGLQFRGLIPALLESLAFVESFHSWEYRIILSQ